MVKLVNCYRKVAVEGNIMGSSWLKKKALVVRDKATQEKLHFHCVTSRK